METKEVRVWGIHTKDDELFLKDGVIAIGWSIAGDLSKIAPDRESFREKMYECYPEASKQSIATQTGQLYRYVHEMQVGDYVIFPSKSNRMINIGMVESEYFYYPEALNTTYHYVNRRKVKWITYTRANV